MKKFHNEEVMKKIAALIFILSLCLAFCACGNNVRDLTVPCACGQDYFSLPLKMKGMFELPGTVSFASDMTLEELKDTIGETDFGTVSVQASVYGNMLAIEKTDAREKIHVYFVYRPSGSGRLYLCNGGFMGVVVPFHLLEEREEWRYSLLGIETETPYPTRYAFEDFVAFYEKFEEYDLQISEDSILVGCKEGDRVRLTFEESAVVFTCEDI